MIKVSNITKKLHCCNYKLSLTETCEFLLNHFDRWLDGRRLCWSSPSLLVHFPVLTPPSTMYVLTDFRSYYTSHCIAPNMKKISKLNLCRSESSHQNSHFLHKLIKSIIKLLNSVWLKYNDQPKSRRKKLKK